jgi:GntR family transcriptional regulator, transcriptional repressor for pyruvate dehydrogenase complex
VQRESRRPSCGDPRRRLLAGCGIARLWQTSAVSARQYESAAHRLRELIKETGLVPGDKLPPERELAERLGVSRTSVRQALTLMRASGAVEPRQGAGIYLRRRIDDLGEEVSAARVGELRQHQLAAVMEAREGLEIQLARLAARRRAPRDIEVMRQALDGMARAIAVRQDVTEFDKRFHEQIARSADSPLLQDLIGQLAEPISQTRMVSLARPGRAQRSLAGHLRILGAIERRDEDEAAEAMREHLMFVAFHS